MFSVSRSKRILFLFLLGFGLYLGVMQTGVAKTIAPVVANYELDCGEELHCPEFLHSRVAFWIEVFSRWDTDTAIFHDKDEPARVYSTIRRKEGCRKIRRGDAGDRERKRLKRELATLSDRLKHGRRLSNRQQQLLAQFEQQDAAEIKRASKRIRCQSGNSDRMREALTQFDAYKPYILDALEAHNLTHELQYLPFVESAFNPLAQSHVGAAGLWQIMPTTGRKLGLKINYAVDERYDPRRSTVAAAMYFRDSVNKLSETAFTEGHEVTPESLIPFVITSYNYGVRGMQRGISKVGLDYARLLTEYKSPNFQIAVKNFYASFLAARHVAKNVDAYFGTVEADHSQLFHSFNRVQLDRATSLSRLSKHLGLDKDTILQMNPALQKSVKRNKALIPKSFTLRLPYKEAGWKESMLTISKLPAEYEKPGYITHRVRRGDTACQIAERYRASCRALIKMNRLNKRSTIYVGQRLKVPTKNGGIGVQQTGNTIASTGGDTYRVTRGDTACTIAERHHMRCGELLALNGLHRTSIIKEGQRLLVSRQNAWHVVERGQTACGIAAQYRVSCRSLIKANQLSSTAMIRIGQRLRIPASI